MSSSHCGSGGFWGGLRTERGLDWAQAAFPMDKLQGEQNKHSCCAFKGDRRERKRKKNPTMNKKETSPSIPLKAQRGHLVLEVIEGTEVVEYSDNTGRRESRGEEKSSVAVQQKTTNLYTINKSQKIYLSFFTIVLTQT